MSRRAAPIFSFQLFSAPIFDSESSVSPCLVPIRIPIRHRPVGYRLTHTIRVQFGHRIGTRPVGVDSEFESAPNRGIPMTRSQKSAPKTTKNWKSAPHSESSAKNRLTDSDWGQIGPRSESKMFIGMAALRYVGIIRNTKFVVLKPKPWQEIGGNRLQTNRR